MHQAVIISEASKRPGEHHASHLQMTVVQPKVSTEGSLRTMAFLAAILRVPSARHVVMTAGRPSGMATAMSVMATMMKLSL